MSAEVASPPRVSILMPSLNQAAFIGEAIASIDLDAHPDAELVVADGGSTDGTLDILAEAAARFPGRVRWRSAPDAGPADAVNEALRRSRGAFIGWLNADDRYRPGAVGRAIEHLARHRDQVMVYGHAEHVDVAGRPLGPYPTVGPRDWLAQAVHGCGVCQPTAFLRREPLLRLRGLDTGLRAAFDFDLWLRLWQAYPGGVGFVDAVQAQSRLHGGGITLRERRTVALEALRVLRRHLGVAPAHWLHTWIDERIAAHPWAADRQPLHEALQTALRDAAADLGEDGTATVAERIERHAAVRLATPVVAMDLTDDGWALARTCVRWMQPADGSSTLAEIRVEAEHAHPTGTPMRLRIASGDGVVQALAIPGNGRFTITLPVADRRAQARGTFVVDCLDPFTPNAVESGSADTRRLGFRVLAIAH